MNGRSRNTSRAISDQRRSRRKCSSTSCSSPVMTSSLSARTIRTPRVSSIRWKRRVRSCRIAGGFGRKILCRQRARLLPHLKLGLRVGHVVMDNSELEKRITVLEDIEAIKRLKALYCAICDDDHNRTGLSSDVHRRRDMGRPAISVRPRDIGDCANYSKAFPNDQLLTAQPDESDHRSRWRPCEGHLVPHRDRLPFAAESALDGWRAVTKMTTSRSMANGNSGIFARSALWRLLTRKVGPIPTNVDLSFDPEFTCQISAVLPRQALDTIPAPAPWDGPSVASTAAKMNQSIPPSALFQ